VANNKVIPFEQSPLELQSLKDILIKGTGSAVGAYAGFVAAGSHPMVLVVVPAGIVLFGAAFGVAKALEDGLYEKLMGIMGVKTKRGKQRTPPTSSGGGGTSGRKQRPDTPRKRSDA
jgi:4-hydroxybenzoate polyprenyltransferase